MNDDGLSQEKDTAVDNAGAAFDEQTPLATDMAAFQIEHRRGSAHRHPQDSAAATMLTRLTFGCGVISILLIFVGSVGDQSVLLSEGLHSLADTFCYLIAWLIDRKSRMQLPKQEFPFGIKRLTVLGGFFNGCFLATSVLFISLENISQLVVGSDDELDDRTVIFWAITVGCIEFSFNLWVGLTHLHDNHGHSHAHGHSHDDANAQGALLHCFTDLATSLVVVVTSALRLVLSKEGWRFMNLLGCVIISSVMAISARKLLRSCGMILLQSTPDSFQLDSVLNGIVSIAGVIDVQRIRVWQLDDKDNLIADLLVHTDIEIRKTSDIVQDIRQLLRQEGVADATIECR